MNTILIVVWFAISQGHMRSTEHHPQIQMQTFQNRNACENAAAVIKQMTAGAQIQTTCVDSSVYR